MNPFRLTCAVLSCLLRLPLLALTFVVWSLLVLIGWELLPPGVREPVDRLVVHPVAAAIADRLGVQRSASAPEAPGSMPAGPQPQTGGPVRPSPTDSR